jgi:hypothetical protein
MKPIYSKDISDKLKGLGIYQIIGGVIGLFITIKLILEQETFPILLLVLFLIPIVLYAYSIYCGILMLKLNEKGLFHSLINQYLQLINFSILGYMFQFVSGLYLSTGIDLTNLLKFKFNLGISSWQIIFNGEDENASISINLVALFLIIFIDKIKMKIKERKLELDLLKPSQ